MSQVCHGLDEPQATNVLVIRLHASCKVAGWNAPYFRQHTHHRQYNTILLLIIEITWFHHLAHPVRQLWARRLFCCIASQISRIASQIYRQQHLMLSIPSQWDSSFDLKNLLRRTGMKLGRPRNVCCRDRRRTHQMRRCETAAWNSR